MSRRRCVWFVIASVVCGFACAAEPWPRWRGAEAAGDGGDAVFPHEWADDAWAWTADLPGVGHASPVVWGGRVYTAAADEPLWHVDLGPFVGEHGFGATPAVCGEGRGDNALVAVRIPEAGGGPPAVVGRRIVFRTVGRLLALDAK